MAADARLALIDLLNRYCDALDMRDWDRLRGYFTDEAVLTARMVDRGVRGPAINHVAGAEAIVAMIRTMWTNVGSTHHFVTNHSIEVLADGRSARGTCYLRAYHEGDGPESGVVEESLALFDCEVGAVGGAWKLRSWEEGIFVMRGTDEVFGPP